MSPELAHPDPTKVHGLMAEFMDPQAMLDAAEAVYAAGYRKYDAYTPFPISGMYEKLHFSPTWIQLLMLVGGLTGAGGAFLMMYYSSVLSWQWNIGGRPTNSWPAFIPTVFEVAVLVSMLVGFFGMLALNRLPRLYDPVFNVPSFRRASIDRFFLVIEAEDELFDLHRTGQLLRSLKPRRINVVPK